MTPAKAPGRPVRASATQLSDLTYPPDANIHGTVFGGTILAMVDKAAAVCGMRHAGKPVVTVAMERVEFLVPIRVGDYVIVEAKLNFVGRSSMEIGVEVYAENLKTGRRQHSNNCIVTMVAVDEKGRPSPVPPLILETREDKARFNAAEARRKARAK